jgi:hypothetical protein
MRAYVGKVVDPDSEPLGHRSKRALNGRRVLTKRPRAARPVARKNHVHRTPHADGALELALPAPDGATMFRAPAQHARRRRRVIVATKSSERSVSGQCFWSSA